MTDERDLLDALGEISREEAAAREAVQPSNHGRARFIEAVAAEREHPRASLFRKHWMMLAAAAMVCSLVIGSVVVIRGRHASVEYTVEGASTSSGGFVQAAADRDAVVHFDDGSSVTLTPGARGRVNEVRPRGASFSVERGRVSVHVAKREGGADYDLNAGPYDVRVTGTRFQLSWDPDAEAMRLVLEEGSVVVTGPHAEAGVGVREGQVLEVSSRGDLRLADANASTASATPPATVTAPTATVASVDPAPSAQSTAPQGLAANAPQGASWAQRVAKGDWAAVLAEADARGMEATLGSASLEDLMALADAGRYAGRSGVANGALQAVRKRYAGTKHAANAAFLLGRMAEGSGNTGSAISLYDATVSEGGAFASEALGRKMMLVQQSSGRDAAQKVARQYLRVYPKGPYADAARDLLK